MSAEDFDISAYIPAIMQAIMTGQVDEMLANAHLVGEVIGNAAYETFSERVSAEIAKQLQPVNDTLNLVLQSQGRLDSLVDAFTSSEPKGMLGKMVKRMLESGE